uniref:Uncharacterized protein n=1 Tax=Ciona intestinalis TaxID=7719 RepID=H2XKY4_CIOIN
YKSLFEQVLKTVIRFQINNIHNGCRAPRRRTLQLKLCIFSNTYELPRKGLSNFVGNCF